MPWIRVRAAKHVAVASLLSVALVAPAVAQDSLRLAQGRDIVAMPSMGRVIFVFLLVAVLAVAAAYALRRYSPKFARSLSQRGSLRVIGRSTINPGLHVHLVEADGARILIAENRAGISMLQLANSAQNNIKNESP